MVTDPRRVDVLGACRYEEAAQRCVELEDQLNSRDNQVMEFEARQSDIIAEMMDAQNAFEDLSRVAAAGADDVRSAGRSLAAVSESLKAALAGDTVDLGTMFDTNLSMEAEKERLASPSQDAVGPGRGRHHMHGDMSRRAPGVALQSAIETLQGEVANMLSVFQEKTAADESTQCHVQ